MKQSDAETTDMELRVAEFTALRNEILKRMEMRHQFMIFALVAAGTFLSLGAGPEISIFVPLIYPILALFLAWGWMHNDVRISQLGDYIRENIEPEQPLMFQHYKNQQRKQRPTGLILEGFQFPTAGAVLSTQVLALIIACSRWEPSIPVYTVLALDILAMGLTVYLTARRTMDRLQKKRGTPKVDMAAEQSLRGDA
jgi:hypothetical protein